MPAAISASTADNASVTIKYCDNCNTYISLRKNNTFLHIWNTDLYSLEISLTQFAASDGSLPV